MGSHEVDLSGVEMLDAVLDQEPESESASIFPLDEWADIAIQGCDPIDDDDEFAHPSSVLQMATEIMEGEPPEEGNDELGSIVKEKTIEPSSSFPENPHPVCLLGPDYYGIGSSRVSLSRLSCRQHDCPACGPRMISALSAAGEAVLEKMYGGWSAVGFQVEFADPTESKRRVAKALHQWMNPRAENEVSKAAPTHRGWLSISPTPGVTVYMLMWDGEEHAPSSRLRESWGMPAGTTPLVEGWKTMCEAVELDTWRAALADMRNHKGKREKLHEHILGGERGARGDVAWVRDALLGRVRRDVEDDPDYLSKKSTKNDADRARRLAGPKKVKEAAEKPRGFRTYEDRKKVKAKIEALSRDTVITVGEEVTDKRKGKVTETITLTDSPEQIGGVVTHLLQSGQVKRSSDRTPAPRYTVGPDGLLILTDFGRGVGARGTDTSALVEDAAVYDLFSGRKVS